MLAVVTWMARLTPLTLAGAGAVIVVLLAAAWFKPEAPALRQSDLDRLKTERAAQERRLLAQARATPPTGRINLNFDRLNFNLPSEIQHPFADGKGYGTYLPASIKGYDGREIRIQGYMLPTKLEHGLVKDCLVLANQMSCCFGLEPRFCQFIAVHIDGPVTPDLMDQPLRFEGKLRVGDVFDHGVWVALYSMNCTAVTP